MFISAIPAFSLNHANSASYGRKDNNRVNMSNKLKSDVFNKSKISFKRSYSREELRNFIKETESKQSDIKRFNMFNDDVVVKVSLPEEAKNGGKEFFTLFKIKDIAPDIAAIPYDMIDETGKEYLAQTLLRGTHPLETNLTPEHLKDITEKFFKLDINGIVNNNLNAEHVFLTNDGKAAFGGFSNSSILLNEGHYINTTLSNTEKFLYEGEFWNRTNHVAGAEAAKKGKFLATYYSKEPLANLKDTVLNPHLHLKTNVENFEYNTLFDYLKSGKEENPLEFFRTYLKTKAQNYHEKMAEWLELMGQNIRTPEERVINKQALAHEKTLAEIFARPKKAVIDAELAKIQIKYLASYAQNKELASAAYQELLKNISKTEKTAGEGEKKYFESLIKHINAIFAEEKIPLETKLNMPQENNLLNIVYKKAAPIITNVKEKVDDVIKAEKTIIEETAEIADKKPVQTIIEEAVQIIDEKPLENIIEEAVSSSKNTPLETIIEETKNSSEKIKEGAEELVQKVKTSNKKLYIGAGVAIAAIAAGYYAFKTGYKHHPGTETKNLNLKG